MGKTGGVIDVASFNGSFTKIALTAQNQRVNELAEYNIGDRVEIGYSVTAREYQGKWFNNVDLVNIKPDGESAPAAPATSTGCTCSTKTGGKTCQDNSSNSGRGGGRTKGG